MEAHHLLGLLYLEGGDEVKAFDEWDIALALAPEHHGARRQIAFLCHARGEVEAAERHLEKALEGDFEDREVRRLLEEIYAANARPADRAAAPRPPGPRRRQLPPHRTPRPSRPRRLSPRPWRRRLRRPRPRLPRQPPPQGRRRASRARTTRCRASCGRWGRSGG